jgi:hypothetical protein
MLVRKRLMGPNRHRCVLVNISGTRVRDNGRRWDIHIRGQTAKCKLVYIDIFGHANAMSTPWAHLQWRCFCGSGPRSLRLRVDQPFVVVIHSSTCNKPSNSIDHWGLIVSGAAGGLLQSLGRRRVQLSHVSIFLPFLAKQCLLLSAHQVSMPMTLDCTTMWSWLLNGQITL